MAIQNTEIADAFEAVADLLDIEASHPFRIRAYRNAARTLRAYPQRMADLVDADEDLSRIPTIGDDLAEKIRQMVETGHLPLLKTLEARTPATLRDLLAIEGLGPKRVATLYRALNIRSLDDLRRALRGHSVHKLPGFGPKSEQRLRDRVSKAPASSGRIKLTRAEPVASELVAYLRRCKGVREVTVAGSYRRRRDTIGDLDILVTAPPSVDVTSYLADYDDVETVISSGSTRSTVRLRGGLQVDVRVLPLASYGAAMVYFTGAKAHTIALRKMAQAKGLKLNERGLFEQDRRIAGRTEKSVYAALGLDYIEPELREDRGELDAAAHHRLPALIELGDIRGDLHCHTDASDGSDTMAQMARAARTRGYEYLSISDHSKRLTVAHGLDQRRVLDQIRKIDRLNKTLDGIVLLKSIEVDILEDGSLDLPDSILRQLDLTVCAIHHAFDLSQKKQTGRILRAMDNPNFNILAHPTGRRLLARAPYAVDIEAIMRGAVERGCFLEVNAHPDRLDLNDEACRLAGQLGLKVSIATDAHSGVGLDAMRLGVDQARRGWLEKSDILNTRSLASLRKLLARD